MCAECGCARRAGELVERIVAADVLTHRNETSILLPERGCMHRARLAIELLTRCQRIERAQEVGRHCGEAVAHAPAWAHGFGQTFDAAKAAAGRAGHMPPALVERIGRRVGKPHATDAISPSTIEPVDFLREPTCLRSA